MSKALAKKTKSMKCRTDTPRNFLLPRGLAAAADANALNTARTKSEAKAHHEAEARAAAEALAAKIKDRTVTIKVKGGRFRQAVRQGYRQGGGRGAWPAYRRRDRQEKGGTARRHQGVRRMHRPGAAVCRRCGQFPDQRPAAGLSGMSEHRLKTGGRGCPCGQ